MDEIWAQFLGLNICKCTIITCSEHRSCILVFECCGCQAPGTNPRLNCSLHRGLLTFNIHRSGSVTDFNILASQIDFFALLSHLETQPSLGPRLHSKTSYEQKAKLSSASMLYSVPQNSVSGSMQRVPASTVRTPAVSCVTAALTAQAALANLYRHGPQQLTTLAHGWQREQLQKADGSFLRHVATPRVACFAASAPVAPADESQSSRLAYLSAHAHACVYDTWLCHCSSPVGPYEAQ